MSNMNEHMASYEYHKMQLIGNLNQMATNMREAANAAEQLVQMIGAFPYGANPGAFAALANGQYQMPVMPPMPMVQDEHGKKRKSRGEDADGKRKVKKIKDPLAPKRPPSSYLLFQNDVRNELKAKNPGMRNNELLSAIAKLWSEMPQDQKDQYEQRNKAAKDTWLAQKLVYEQGKAGAAAVPVKVAAVPAVAAPVAAIPVAAAPAPAAAAAQSDTSEEEEDDDEESSGSADASSDGESPVEPPPKKSKKEAVAAATPSKEEGKKEKKHKKAKA
ncbi:HMG-box [Lentinus tigrinus ALCF2SS1-7]|uniref:HMG-box n=1 Tax=Lentinus tigrinus ALCF2SS1-6 TaxID=1328759 RepID=A0A5C2SEL1_9APHY|nr:HMG-box [Lentinus tigrinus ALCF2SS1-6]RPD74611.1 HMG-box [Lentinus tigrinus ALCF2SS1-7]